MKLRKPTSKVLTIANGYTWVIAGKTVKLSEMDRGQLMQALMDTIDAMENIENDMSNITDHLDRWRNGLPGNWDA